MSPSKPDGLPTPSSIFFASMKNVPGKLRVLYAVAAVASIVAMAHVWGIDRGWSILAALIIVFVAVILTVLQATSRRLQQNLVGPALVLAWSVVVLFTIWCVLLTGCVFFSWPKPVSFLPLSPVPQPKKSALIQSLETDWANAKYSRDDIPQQLVADIENILTRPELLVATEMPTVENLKSADIIICHYADLSSKYVLGRKWVDVTRDSYRARKDILSFIQNRLLLLDLIISELKRVPGAAKRSAELINEGFSVVSSLEATSWDIPAGLRGSYSVDQVILYLRRAQLTAKDGKWDVGDVNQAASIAMQVADISLYNAAQVANAVTRAANAATDTKSASDMLESLSLRQRFINVYSSRFERESPQVTKDNWGFLVNYAKLEEEQFLFQSFTDASGNQVNVPHWTNEQIERLRYLTRSQERVAAYVQSFSRHDWANISLDASRFHALQYEWLLEDAARAREAMAARDRSVELILGIDGAEGVQRTETKRLFTDIINRAEFYTIKDDPRLSSIVAYVKEHGI